MFRQPNFHGIILNAKEDLFREINYRIFHISLTKLTTTDAVFTESEATTALYIPHAMPYIMLLAHGTL